MSENAITINMIAGGNVLPKTFVKGDTSNSLTCLQAGAGDVPIGVTGNWTRYAPGTASDDGFQAVATEFPEAVAVGGITPITAGAAFGAFVFLKPDAAGKAIATTAVSDIPGAFSLEAAAGAGEAIRCLVLAPAAAGSIASNAPIVTAANYTATASDSGKLIQVTAADKTVTLPTGVTGMKYKILCTGLASTGGSVGTIVHVPTGDTLNGQLVEGTAITPASGKGAVNTHGTAITGDFLVVVCTAANTWWVDDVRGIWARES